MNAQQVSPAFDLPDARAIANLMVERINETTLKPDTPVICLNRGRKVLKDTWDGNHVELPVGYFRTEYGAALHFQKRLIVPGTRNLEVGGFISWIAILGPDDQRLRVDAEDACEPFSDEELQAFGEAIEGIDRSSGAPVTAVRVSQARASAVGQGVGGLRPQIKADQQFSDAAREAAQHVFDPPAENYARQETAEAAAEAGAPAARSGRTRAR